MFKYLRIGRNLNLLKNDKSNCVRPLLDELVDVRVVIGAAEVGYAAVVVVSEVVEGAGRNVADERRPDSKEMPFTIVIIKRLSSSRVCGYVCRYLNCLKLSKENKWLEGVFVTRDE